MTRLSRYCVLFTLVVVGQSALAQEFRVYTKVYDEAAATEQADAAAGGPAPIASRSLTLFHAGKVYDSIQSVGEIVVFEPAHRRFTLVSTKESIATEVEFDQIRHLMKTARAAAVEQLERQHARTPTTSGGDAEWLETQLTPDFEKRTDKDPRMLNLVGRHMRYDVRHADAKHPETVDAYLEYADWTTQLNYLLYPGAMLPYPRLALNESLRRLPAMPMEVTLRADTDVPIHLRAEHRIHWELNARDRNLIHHWEQLLKSPDVRRVSFREYQRRVLERLTAEG